MTPFDSSQVPLSGGEVIRAFFPRSPYVVYLGMQLTGLHRGLAILTLPFQNSSITVGTTVHGGAIASLIDTAAMVAAWSGAEATASTHGTTVALTVNYLAAAQNEDIQATARVLKRGRNLIYLDVEVTGAMGMLIAKGLVTYKLG
jgi:uncharacterized protein (TIGR00369 family)